MTEINRGIQSKRFQRIVEVPMERVRLRNHSLPPARRNTQILTKPINHYNTLERVIAGGQGVLTSRNLSVNRIGSSSGYFLRNSSSSFLNFELHTMLTECVTMLLPPRPGGCDLETSTRSTRKNHDDGSLTASASANERCTGQNGRTYVERRRRDNIYAFAVVVPRLLSVVVYKYNIVLSLRRRTTESTSCRRSIRTSRTCAAAWVYGWSRRRACDVAGGSAAAGWPSRPVALGMSGPRPSPRRPTDRPHRAPASSRPGRPRFRN